jgi:hypothetical protein
VSILHGPGGIARPATIPLQDAATRLAEQIERHAGYLAQLEEYANKVERELEDERREAGRLRARVEELEALPDPVITFGEADDRRGFVLFIDGVQVGKPVTYDDFGWGGIDLAQTLILAVAEAFGGEVTGP